MPAEETWRALCASSVEAGWQSWIACLEQAFRQRACCNTAKELWAAFRSSIKGPALTGAGRARASAPFVV
eukprot:6475257-Alexandrium_andersonii.AAC.1